MNARRFDALAVTLSSGSHKTSRRLVLRGMALVAVMGLTPGAARAFDGGIAPTIPVASGLGCTSGADCAAGEICLNGVCSPRTAVGGTELAGSTQPTGTVPSTTISTTPVAEPQTGVGGLIQPGEPLPARIFAGRCGSLGDQVAFQLIDLGSVEGAEEGETPQGALTAIPAEFSTTVVNATLVDLLDAEHAIDVRVDAADPATSIACGDIGGPVDTGAGGNELAVGLQERGDSAYSGIAWLQEEDQRTIVRVFLARGLEGGQIVATQPEVEIAQEIPAATETEAEAAPVVEGTPVIGAVEPLAPGSTVVTTIDVNLRSEPTEDAEVLTILGEGVQLEVTSAPQDGWIGVADPVSGQSGFVSDQFVALA
jgi:uncharacterized protein YgiM (DUF1202 family)